MRVPIGASAVLVLAATAACAPSRRTDATPATPAQAVGEAEVAPRNVILLIGDGVGTAYWTAALFAADSLAVEQMPVAGLVDTRSASSRVTDSAAGATVYATGVRTYNGAIGVGVDCIAMVQADSAAVSRDPASCDPLTTVFELAEDRGMATGLVATSSITHATPASFATHVPSRAMQAAIAAQLAESEVDVMLGGGHGFFDGSLRPDSVDLLTALCEEADCISTSAELADYRAGDRRLIGLFAENQMEAAALREPSLPDMTGVALEKLSRNPRGFFLVVEGSQPDWRGHDNEPLQAVVDEMIDFDRAIGVALDHARSNPETLVVVTADHETGGLALHEDADSVVAAYTTDYHTGEMVPLFAYGAGAERFGGIHENREIGQMLVEIARSER